MNNMSCVFVDTLDWLIADWLMSRVAGCENRARIEPE
jgi:hypothetical protein